MQKKFFSLLFFFVTSHIPNAIAINGSSSVLLVNNENETETEAEADTYVPPVENYHSLVVEPVKVDYLYNLDSQQSAFAQKVKKIDWRGLFRANAAFLYAIRINRSRFAVCLGGGVNTLYYAFDGQNRGGENVYPTLRRDSKSRTECRDLDNKTGKKYTYSAFEIPFVDVLLRLRFNSVLSEPKAGYHGWLGLKFGIRRSASVILHYEEYDDTGASTVHKGNFNLKPYAFALQAGMGYHRFGLAFRWYLTPLFNENQGPSYTDKLRPFSFSIYADLV